MVDRYKKFSLTDPEAWRQLSGFQGKHPLVDSVYNAADNIDAAESITSFWGEDVWVGLVDTQKVCGLRRSARRSPVRIRKVTFGLPTSGARKHVRPTWFVSHSGTILKVVSNVAGYHHQERLFYERVVKESKYRLRMGTN